MERSFFPEKLSFAVLVWLAVAFNMSAHSHVLKTYIDDVTRSTNYSLNQLFQLVPQYDGLSVVFNKVTQPKLALKEIPTDDLKCMAENIYYEAGNQSYVGKLAVGQVVLNRVKTPGYPNTVCKVIYEGSQSAHTSICQFSWLCEADRKAINKSSEYWKQSLKAASELLSKRGMVLDITEGATNYHADYIKDPPWSKQLHFVAQIDQHIFYRKR